jgi:hypothetical protein
MAIDIAPTDISFRLFTPREEWTLSRTTTRPLRGGIWALLIGIAICYGIGWVQDVQRIHGLRAELLPLTKVVITKQQAWERIHPARLARRVPVKAGFWPALSPLPVLDRELDDVGPALEAQPLEAAWFHGDLRALAKLAHPVGDDGLTLRE